MLSIFTMSFHLALLSLVAFISNAQIFTVEKWKNVEIEKQSGRERQRKSEWRKMKHKNCLYFHMLQIGEERRAHLKWNILYTSSLSSLVGLCEHRCVFPFNATVWFRLFFYPFTHSPRSRSLFSSFISFFTYNIGVFYLFCSRVLPSVRERVKKVLPKRVRERERGEKMSEKRVRAS